MKFLKVLSFVLGAANLIASCYFERKGDYKRATLYLVWAVLFFQN